MQETQAARLTAVISDRATEGTGVAAAGEGGGVIVAEGITKMPGP